MPIHTLISQGLSGLSMGMVLFMISVGLCLIFGTVRVLNLAHGSMYMVGAFLCYWFNNVLFQHFTGAFWMAVIVGPLVVAFLGWVVETLLFRRIYYRDMIYQLILTFGLVLLLSDLCKIVWGVEYHMVPYPQGLNGAISFLGVVFPVYNIFLIIMGIVVFVGLWAFIKHSRVGRIIRAITYDRDMVDALGVNVRRTYTLIFVLSCWLAGLGGALTAPINVIALGMDAEILIECFIIVVIGGLGSMTGAFLGAILFGLVNSFGILIAPQLAIAFTFLLMALILIVRPWGLLGVPE